MFNGHTVLDMGWCMILTLLLVLEKLAMSEPLLFPIHLGLGMCLEDSVVTGGT